MHSQTQENHSFIFSFAFDISLNFQLCELEHRQLNTQNSKTSAGLHALTW